MTPFTSEIASEINLVEWKLGEIEDPTLLWSNATSNAWIVMAYPPIQLPDELPPFQSLGE
jgi:hypothetical protein